MSTELVGELQAYEKFVLVQLRHRLPAANVIVHQRLRERGLVQLVVSPRNGINADGSERKRVQSNQRRYVIRSMTISCHVRSVKPTKLRSATANLAEVVAIQECYLHCSHNVCNTRMSMLRRVLACRQTFPVMKAQHAIANTGT